MLRLIMTWRIREGKEAELPEFVSGELIKLLVSMNIHPTDAWYAVSGQGVGVMAGGIVDDMSTMERALKSQEWKTLCEKLRDLAVDFTHKVVKHTGSFQL